MRYRAELNADVTLTTGGRLQTQGLLVDVPHLDVTQADLATILVGALGLRDVERVELSGIRTFAEPATTGVPAPPRLRFVELSHVISDGMTTYPGMPSPVVSAHLTWADSRPRYAEGTEFSLDKIEMVGQTGTYLDAPRHRYEGGTDLAGLPLERLADLPAVVVRTAGSGRRAVTEADLEPYAVAGHAVLLHTGGDRGWGTPGYGVDAPYLTGAAAALLVERGAALVGIDSINLDDNTEASGGERPAHTVLLAAGIPIVEHLTGLEDLPPHGARFTAAPPRITAFGTFPVRAYAQVPYHEAHDHSRSAGWMPTR
ncbi:cyclase family protein [Paractinoplanes lichenicola]|uniref:Cyclase family protein n=1 Tax=Paractinoplanes lichenicola TaxID=2802976 RepID=A0ABS1VRN7_9ACTN|nr:cyclase family protein [Actinoplanes lichenicola]MBL7257345.1 cyclase family protein [Actinoplanes lichenicola]